MLTHAFFYAMVKPSCSLMLLDSGGRTVRYWEKRAPSNGYWAIGNPDQKLELGEIEGTPPHARRKKEIDRRHLNGSR
ncbi:hypothetical protein V6N13_033573 [Hibiscus sabdariffa]|uniref:Uncharacterized protein n=1 Tax=Hibiscus sabdariffa TaxID=183260 RepID=A0ABR2FA64_9ROSI